MNEMITIPLTSKEPWNFSTVKLKNHTKKVQVIQYVPCDSVGRWWTVNPGTIIEYGVRGKFLVVKHHRRPNIFKAGDYHHKLIICKVDNPQETLEVFLSWLMQDDLKIVGQIAQIQNFVTAK